MPPRASGCLSLTWAALVIATGAFAQSSADFDLVERAASASKQLAQQTFTLTQSVDVCAPMMARQSPDSPQFNASEAQRIMFEAFMLFPEDVEPALWTTWSSGAFLLYSRWSALSALPSDQHKFKDVIYSFRRPDDPDGAVCDAVSESVCNVAFPPTNGASEFSRCASEASSQSGKCCAFPFASPGLCPPANSPAFETRGACGCRTYWATDAAGQPRLMYRTRKYDGRLRPFFSTATEAEEGNGGASAGAWSRWSYGASSGRLMMFYSRTFQASIGAPFMGVVATQLVTSNLENAIRQVLLPTMSAAVVESVGLGLVACVSPNSSCYPKERVAAEGGSGVGTVGLTSGLQSGSRPLRMALQILSSRGMTARAWFMIDGSVVIMRTLEWTNLNLNWTVVVTVEACVNTAFTVAVDPGECVCRSGTSSGAVPGVCTPCSTGTFGNMCSPCNGRGLFCPGFVYDDKADTSGAYRHTMPGFWGHNGSYYPCPHDYLCEGSRSCNWTSPSFQAGSSPECIALADNQSTCSRNMSGPLCLGCDSSKKHRYLLKDAVGSITCSYCPPMPFGTSLLTGLMLFAISQIISVVVMGMHKDPHQKEFSIRLRLFVDTLQMLNILRFVSIEWPSQVAMTLSIGGSASLSVTDMYCSTAQHVPASTLISSLYIPLMALMLLTCVGIIYGISRVSGRFKAVVDSNLAHGGGKKATVIRSLLYCVSLGYPITAVGAIRILSCYSVESERYLSIDTNYSCNIDDTVIIFAVSLGLSISLVVPMAIFWRIRSSKNNSRYNVTKQSKNSSRCASQEAQTSRESKVTVQAKLNDAFGGDRDGYLYGFLWQSYRKGMHLWEPMRVLRQLMYVIGTVIESSALQIMYLETILLVYFSLTVFFKPHKLPELNAVDIASQFLFIVSMLIGQAHFGTNSDVPKYHRDVAAWCVVVLVGSIFVLHTQGLFRSAVWELRKKLMQKRQALGSNQNQSAGDWQHAMDCSDSDASVEILVMNRNPSTTVISNPPAVATDCPTHPEETEGASP